MTPTRPACGRPMAMAMARRSCPRPIEAARWFRSAAIGGRGPRAAAGTPASRSRGSACGSVQQFSCPRPDRHHRGLLLPGTGRDGGQEPGKTGSATSPSALAGRRSATTSSPAWWGSTPVASSASASSPSQWASRSRIPWPSCAAASRSWDSSAATSTPTRAGPLDRSAAHRPQLVPALRGHGRARRACHDPRLRGHQPELPRHGIALPQRRHHRVHAAPAGGPVPRLPEPAADHPARRRRRALPLGPVPRARGHARPTGPPKTR